MRQSYVKGVNNKIVKPGSDIKRM